MKTKVVIKFLILILIVLLVTVIYIISNMMLKKDSNQNFNNYTIQEENNINMLENEEIIGYNGIAAPEEGYNDSDYIFYNEQEVVEYNNSQLNNIDFTFINIPNDVNNYVINIESVKKQIKKYVYLNGLIDSTIANYKTHQIQEENNKIAILFELNNKKKTQLIVMVNKNDNLVEINER